MSDRLRLFIPFIFAWLWSTGFVSTKTGLPYAEPFTMLALRHILTIAVFALIIYFFRFGFGPIKGAAQQMLVGLLLHGAYLGGVFYAIANGMPAGASAIIVGFQPILTSVLARIFFEEKMSRGQVLGLGFGLVGLSLVVAPDLAGQNIPLIGVATSLIALLGISVGTVLQKRMKREMSLATGNLYQFAGALIAMTLLSLLFETREITPHWEFVATMAWLIFGISVSAMLLLMLMIREGAVSEVAAYFYLVTPLAVLQAWLFFGETLSPTAIIGAALTVLGVYLATTSRA